MAATHKYVEIVYDLFTLRQLRSLAASLAHSFLQLFVLRLLDHIMYSSTLVTLYAASLVNGMIIFRQNGAPDPGDATLPTDPGVQAVPASAKPDNTFSNGAAEIIGGFPYDSGTIPDLYQPREIDIPFGCQFHGDLMMFPEGQLNQPGFNTDEYTPNLYDFANQSACGIPDNSYVQMKVAIHPYFLKYAGLDRELPYFCDLPDAYSSPSHFESRFFSY